MLRLAFLAAAVLAVPPLAHADDLRSPDTPTVRIGGYAQPQFRARQNDPVAQFDENGFRLRRARLTLHASKDLTDEIEAEFKLESELTPVFQLLDAYVATHGPTVRGGRWELDLGQIRAPFSRQDMVSDAEQQFVEKAQLTSLAPGRQLGVRGILNVPAAPMVELSAAMFNGEGRNQLDNIDEKFMYVGRVAVSPIGWDVKRSEGGFGEDQVQVAASVLHNTRDVGAFLETELGFGVDAFVRLRGVTAYAEYLRIKTDFPEESAQVDFESQGLNLQLGYLLPLSGFLYKRLEVAARYEEFDARFPNQDFPIEGPGDPNQSTRSVLVGVSYYHDEHNLKLQLSLAKNLEVEDRDRNNMDATYANDTLLVQLTYRLE